MKRKPEPLTLMYPDKLPDNLDTSRHTVAYVHDDKHLMHPKLYRAVGHEMEEVVLRAPDAARIRLMRELHYLYGWSKTRTVVYLAQWVTDGRPDTRGRNWRNPTPAEIAKALGLESTTVSSIISVRQRSTNANIERYLSGDAGFRWLRSEAGKYPLMRFPIALYGEYGYDARGCRPGTELRAAPCSLCGKAPRIKECGLTFRASCPRQMKYNARGTKKRYVAVCPHSRNDIRAKTRNEAYRLWNELNMED